MRVLRCVIRKLVCFFNDGCTFGITYTNTLAGGVD